MTRHPRKKCPHSRTPESLYANGGCKVCASERQKLPKVHKRDLENARKRRAADPEKFRAYVRKYYVRHRKRVLRRIVRYRKIKKHSMRAETRARNAKRLALARAKRMYDARKKAVVRFHSL